MTKLTTSHPAVEAAMMEMTKGSSPLVRTVFRTQALNEALKVLEAALPHLTAERDAYREENTCLREDRARAEIDLTDMVERMEELADRWESVVSSDDYESAMRNAATDLRNALNGDAND